MEQPLTESQLLHGAVYTVTDVGGETWKRMTYYAPFRVFIARWETTYGGRVEHDEKRIPIEDAKIIVREGV